MLYMKQEEAVDVPALFSSQTEEGAHTTGSKKKRPIASTFLKEGIDCGQIARAFLTNDGSSRAPRSKVGLGYKAHCQFSAAARIDSACRGLKHVEIEQLPVGKSGHKFKLSVKFTSERKKHEEITPSYNKQQVVDICAEIQSKQTTSKRRKTSSKHMINMEQIAHRSPPLFWSIFYEFVCSAPCVAMADAVDQVQALSAAAVLFTK
jgi:hypothetical protein